MILGRSRAIFLVPFTFFFFVVTGLISGFLDRSNVLQVQIFSLARQPAISFVKVAAVGAKGLEKKTLHVRLHNAFRQPAKLL